ncbi:MAG: HEAT repeat domain-containing protein [Anaerolineae bacterium]|jgi:HEAT repeat protein|nr:HEAT repeat domain-containing protein [Anaerolineae bacterium]
MPLFGPPDVDKLSDRRDVKGLIKALGYPKDEWVRCKAAIALGWINDARAVEPLIAALKDENAKVCEAAAKALKQLGNVCAVEPLIPVLKDERWWMRKMVAEILGSIGDARAVEPLIAKLTDKQEVATAAAMALGEIGDARAVNPLIAMLAEHNLQKVAAEALGKISDPRAMEELAAVLGDKGKDSTARAAVAMALGKSGSPRAVELLIAILKDQDQSGVVRHAVAKGLGQASDARAVMAALKSSNLLESKEAAETLIGILLTPHEDAIRDAASKALVQLGAPVGDQLLAHLDDGHIWIVKTLAQMSDERAKDALWAYVQSLPEHNIKWRVQCLIEALCSSWPDLHKPAARALEDTLSNGGSDASSQVGLLVRELHHAPEAVRRMGAAILVNVVRRNPLVIEGVHLSIAQDRRANQVFNLPLEQLALELSGKWAQLALPHISYDQFLQQVGWGKCDPATVADVRLAAAIHALFGV